MSTLFEDRFFLLVHERTRHLQKVTFLDTELLANENQCGEFRKATRNPQTKKSWENMKKTKKTKNTVRKLNKKQNNLQKNIKSRLFRKWGASPRLPKNCSCVYFCLFSRVVVWWFPCCLFHGSCLTLLCSVSLWLLFVLPKGFHWKNTLLKTPLWWSAPHWIAAWFRATLVEFVRPSSTCIRKR